MAADLLPPLRATWGLGGGATLHLGAHFGTAALSGVEPMPGAPIYESDAGIGAGGGWPAYAVAFTLKEDA